MIKEFWYAVLYSSEVKKGRMTGAVRLGEKLAFWRDASSGEVYCIKDKCPHRGASLSAGKVHNGHAQCPFHGIEFDGSGSCVLIPANGRSADVPERFNQPSYRTAEKGGLIWIFWSDRLCASDPDESFPSLPWFEDIDEKFRWINWKDPWKCHYSRCIENQLDVVHLPFVHNTTIGRGNASLVNGPRVRTADDNLNVWVYNSRDEGQKPLKPEDTPLPVEGQQHLHFRFPHIWQNWLTEKIRIFIAFVPVDEENTILYLRFCQKFMRIPLLSAIVNIAGLHMSRVITHQDRRVVHTQLPVKTAFKMNENLLQGDGPIIAYRKHRDELLKNNNRDS